MRPNACLKGLDTRASFGFDVALPLVSYIEIAEHHCGHHGGDGQVAQHEARQILRLHEPRRPQRHHQGHAQADRRGRGRSPQQVEPLQERTRQAQEQHVPQYDPLDQQGLASERVEELCQAASAVQRQHERQELTDHDHAQDDRGVTEIGEEALAGPTGQ